MRTSKKLLSVLLAVLMCMSCFGLCLNAAAVNELSSIALACPAPEAGGAFPTVSDVECAPVLQVKSIIIYEVQGNTSVKATAPFENGKTYEINFSMATRTASYNFYRDLTASVNGEACTAVYLTRTTANVVWTVTVGTSQPEVINSVEGLIEDPQLLIGGTAYKMISSVDNNKYKPRCDSTLVGNNFWMMFCTRGTILVRGTDGSLSEVEKTALCEAGKTYYYSFRVEPEAGYALSEDLTVSFVNEVTLAPMPVTLSNLSASGVDVLVELPAPVAPVAAGDPRLPIDHELPYEVIDGLFVGSYPEGNCRWTFDPATGEMIFYATGENATVPPAAEAFDLRAPYDFRFDVRSVYVDEGIRYIGDGAFNYMLGLRKLTLPSTLESVVLYDADYDIHGLPNFPSLKSLETLVSKSNAALNLTLWGTKGPTSTFMSYGPVNDVNDKRALMDIRCAYYNTLFGYLADMDFDCDDPVAMLQSMVDAVNQKYGAHLPAVTSEEVIEGLLNDYINGNTDMGAMDVTVCPAYFRLICPPESAALAEWQLLKEHMAKDLQEGYNERVNDPNNNPNAPGTPTVTDPEVLAERRLEFTTLWEPYHDPAVVNALYDNAVEDISTYTETLPSTYMDRRAANLTVTANASAGGTASGSGKFFPNETATLTATPNSGYHFTGWYEGSAKVSGSAAYTFTVTKDVTLTAKFEKDADPGNNGGNNNPQPQQPANRCHWCGKDHSGNFFQKIIGWFHNIFAKIFGNRY